MPAPKMFNPYDDDSYQCEHCDIKIPHAYLDGGPYSIDTPYGKSSICFSCYESFMDGLGKLGEEE
jgi:hypothetical protein